MQLNLGEREIRKPPSGLGLMVVDAVRSPCILGGDDARLRERQIQNSLMSTSDYATADKRVELCTHGGNGHARGRSSKRARSWARRSPRGRRQVHEGHGGLPGRDRGLPRRERLQGQRRQRLGSGPGEGVHGKSAWTCVELYRKNATRCV